MRRPNRKQTIGLVVALLLFFTVVGVGVWSQHTKRWQAKPQSEASAVTSAEAVTGSTPTSVGVLTSATQPPSSGRPLPSPIATVVNPTPSKAGQDVGMCCVRDYQTPAALEDDLRRIVSTAGRWVRLSVVAHSIEAAPDRRDWTQPDRMVAAAKRHGLKVVATLTTLPPWVGNPGNWRVGASTAIQQRAFAEFARAAATRYRGLVDVWEVWNEPNVGWDPRPEAKQYTALLKLTYPALKRGAPSTPVMVGGLGDSDAPNTVRAVDFVQGMYQAGAKGFYDAMNIHPYPDPTQPRNPNSGVMPVAHQVRQLMDSNGQASMLLWGTEVGAPTGGSYSTSEAGQAALVPGVFAQWRSIHHHGPLLWYCLWDRDGSDREDHFGLFRVDGTAKPALAALQKVAGRSSSG